MTTGLADTERRALAAQLADIAARPGIDRETANRATWLRWHLAGLVPAPSYAELWDRYTAAPPLAPLDPAGR